MKPAEQITALLISAMVFSACAPQSAAPAGSGTLNIYFFAAGKADAVLLYTDESAVLVDSGEAGYGQEVLSYMKAHGIDSLDCMIITHFDKDHVGGAAAVLDNTVVSRVLVSNFPKDSSEYASFVRSLENAGISAEVISGEEEAVFEIDDVLYEVDGPDEELYDKDPSNNSSLITSVTYGDNVFLLTGDAENARISEYLTAHGEDCDLIKIPYHGNYQKQLNHLLEAVTPETAVITCSGQEGGEEKTLSLLAEKEISAYLTYEGGIRIISDGNELRITRE